MSSRFASEHLASFRHDAQRSVEEAGDHEDHALALLWPGAFTKAAPVHSSPSS